MGTVPKRMIRAVLAISAFLGLALARDPFLQFAQDFGKQYKDLEEYSVRREIFLRNYQDMVEHNMRYEAREVSWARKVTEYYDLTFDEFESVAGIKRMEDFQQSYMVGDNADEGFKNKTNEVQRKAPNSFSWVKEGVISPVKNQGKCGSCVTFSTVSLIETCFYQLTGSFADLSEQLIVDCARGHVYHDDNGDWEGKGCYGGWPVSYIDWLVTKNDGNIEKEECYPYRENQGSCRKDESCNYEYATVTGMYNKWHVNEEEMKEMVYQSPVSTNMEATWLHDYSHGVYEDSHCYDADTNPNHHTKYTHEVNVVGYGHQDGKDYWLVKNSLGANWGDHGFFKIKRGTGHCGIGLNHFTTVSCAPK